MKPALKFEPVFAVEAEEEGVVLINVFRVAPEKQDELVRLLDALTDEVTRSMPGFVSSTVYKSLDRKSVVNHARWRDAESWRAMVHDPRVRAWMDPILRIATFEPRLYEAASNHKA